jgi:rSAM/selenodomain-associated transferase 2
MKLSIIIPTWNEALLIERTLSHLREHAPSAEVIVSDGGSSDDTASIACRYSKVVSSKKGRAEQMNYGAQNAGGDIYLFLHADTLLPDQGFALIRQAESRGARAGRFRMKFDDSRWLLRLYALYTRFHLFSYGDQGFFVSRELFQELGGFRTDVPFEDIEFYKRLRRKTKPVILSQSVTTSARRFLETGCWKQKWINIWLVALYYFGFDILSSQRKLYSDVR